MGPVDFSEMSVMNHHYSLRNSAEEGSSQRDLVQIERVKCSVSVDVVYTAYFWCQRCGFILVNPVYCRILIF